MLVPDCSLRRSIAGALDLFKVSDHAYHSNDDDHVDVKDDIENCDGHKYDEYLMQVLLFNAESQTKVYALEHSLHSKAFTLVSNISAEG